MTSNHPTFSETTLPEPITVTVSAWDQDRVIPGTRYYLGVTVTNQGNQDAIVQVRLESPNPVVLRTWCTQLEQWLALSSQKSGELTFCLEVPEDATPQWLDYEVVTSLEGAYSDYYLPPTQRSLQVLAPATTETTQDPTFAISPTTTPSNPILVEPGVPIQAELRIENRSERVDRFRLVCTGLPLDWTYKVDYPRETRGLGLVQIADSLGLNPGDRGSIQVLIYPPPLPLAGHYLPTFRLSSENDPNLGLLSLLYLQVPPVYDLQSQLQVLQDQVRDRPAQFMVQLSNLGNVPRQVQPSLKHLKPTDHPCQYSLPTDPVLVAPQTTTQLLLEAQPEQWWTRPWLGGGRLYSFQVELADGEQHPITPAILQGYLTWMARPWWQLLLVILAGLGLVGTLVFLIWWFFLRPPASTQILEFAAEDSRYSEVNGDMARVRWQIEHPEQIQTLKLSGYSPEGTLLSGPLVYDFQNGKLPVALQPFCSQQKTLLSCSQVRSDAFQPGKYVFELTLIPRGRRAKPTVVKTSPVEIVAKPLPTVTTLVPSSLIYREAAPGTPTAAEKALPVASQAGVLMNWVVTMPADLTALHLVGRDKEGKLIGDLWFVFPRPGQLPEVLRPFCRLEQTLVCRNVPTGLTAVGDYRFELQALAVGQTQATAAKPMTTEIVKIQPQVPQILNFQINGQEAPAKLLIPVIPGQAPPTLQVSWRVQGGSTTQVSLAPAPGNVPLVGKVMLPLSAQGDTTIALQVKSATGEAITRSVTLEVYNPAGNNPAASGGGSGAAGAGSPPPGPAGPAPLGTPTPAVDDRLSPSEQPPQFTPR